MHMAHSGLTECAICTGNSSGVILQTLNRDKSVNNVTFIRNNVTNYL